MKFSEELKLRGAVVGDIYCRDKYGLTGMALDIAQIYNSEYLERLLSGRHDEAGNFIWLRDKNGIKKDITKDAVKEMAVKEMAKIAEKESTVEDIRDIEKLREDSKMLSALRCCGVETWKGYNYALTLKNERPIHEFPSDRDREAVKYCEMEDEIDFDAENYSDDVRKHNIKFLAFIKGWDQGIAWDIANKEKVK